MKKLAFILSFLFCINYAYPSLPLPLSCIDLFSSPAFKEQYGGTILLTYRDNALFQRYVPVLEAYLGSLFRGQVITKKVFPIGTPLEEIRGWFTTNKEKYEREDGLFIVSDDTVRECMDEIIDRSKPTEEYNLDDLMSSATEKVFEDRMADRGMEYKSWDPTTQKECFSGFSKIFGVMLELIPIERRKTMEIIILTAKNDFEYATLSNHTVDSKFPPDDLANLLKQWFTTADITNITIYNTAAEIPEDTAMRLQNTNQTFLVLDRHCYGADTMPRNVHNARLFWGKHFDYSDDIIKTSALRLPPPSFLDDVNTKIGVAVPQRQIEDAINAELTQYFQKDYGYMKELDEQKE